jgi:hypothetical protein
MNKPTKITLSISAAVGFLIVLLFIGLFVANMSRGPISPARQDLDPLLKDEIYRLLNNMVSDKTNEELNRLVTTEENSVRVYNWPAIDNLLLSSYENMTILDYVVLLQLVQNMNEVRSDGSLFVDCEALTEFVRRGRHQGFMTSTLSHICSLYKGWTENALGLPSSGVLFKNNLPQEDKILSDQLQLDMTKTAILDKLMTEDTDRRQSKLRGFTNKNPTILILPGDMDDWNHQPYIIQIGSTDIHVSPFTRAPQYNISNVISELEFALIEDTEKRSISQSEINRRVDRIKALDKWQRTVDALAIGSVLTVSADSTITMISCFNATELQIRVHCYNHYGLALASDQVITAEQLKAEFDMGLEEICLLGSYLDWYKGNEVSIGDYRRQLIDIYGDYQKSHHDFIGVLLEELTPDQINKLVEKKEAGSTYSLDLGNAP